MKIYCIDRFEGELALCEGPDHAVFSLPRALFPQQVKEGDCFTLLQDGAVQLLPKETTKRRRAALRLASKLFQK